MGYASRALLAGGLGFAASLLVACGGSSGLLSGGQADNLNSQLDQVSQAVDAGQCGPARTAASAFSNEVANLPGSVNPALVNNLQQGASTVSQLAAHDCASRTTTTTTTTTSTSPTTSSSTSTSTSSSPSSSSSTSTTTSPTSTSATTTTGTGTSTTTGSSGGAGLSNTGTVSGTGGAGAGNGGGNAQ